MILVIQKKYITCFRFIDHIILLPEGILRSYIWLNLFVLLALEFEMDTKCKIQYY